MYDADTSITSHHDTDPARGTHGAFDLVRLHRFGHLDKDAGELPMTERPSYKAMIEFAASLPELRAARAQGELADLGPAPAQPASNDDWLETPKPSRNRVQKADEFAGALTPREWIVKGVLPKDAELVIVYGESGAGKSFWVDDLTTHAHLGRPWNDRRGARARVVKIVAEGAGDHRYRLHAQAAAFGVPLGELPAVIDNAPDLFEPDQALDVAREIKAAGGCDILCIDTMAATFRRDENAGKDVGPYLHNVKAIQRALGCTVILVSHSGKDSSKGLRGWSGQRAAADVEIEVTGADDESVRTARISKMKGHQDGARFGFRLAAVALGRDADGDVYGSCRVEHVNAPGRRVQKLSGDQQELFEHVCLKLKLEGKAIPATVAVEGLDGHFGTLKRSLDRLARRGLLVRENGLYSLPQPAKPIIAGDPEKTL